MRIFGLYSLILFFVTINDRLPGACGGRDGFGRPRSDGIPCPGLPQDLQRSCCDDGKISPEHGCPRHRILKRLA
ncbi:hypothetical protein PGTUg99_033910 [Puccinia graminis f. sp. tritici]|uniref:Hydrophobin n=1 Tax=Puccinia graminis f. sp. tritici TaxID=56615 RepID=A0A5B0QS53_PUCGR|nr:hypothetical protein PGTUg99_033910 [Puccinia graminis f. sp. tritici]